MTGVSFLLNELGAKRLELLRELVPAATSVGFLANPTRPSFQSEVKNTQRAAQALGVKLIDASFPGGVDDGRASDSRRGQAGTRTRESAGSLFCVPRHAGRMARSMA